MKNFIEKYDNALPHDVCDKIINATLNKDTRSWKGVVGMKEYKPEVKSTTDFDVYKTTNIETVRAIRDSLVKHLLIYIKNNFVKHIPEALESTDEYLLMNFFFPTFVIDQRSLFVKKYSDKNDHFNWHVDNQVNTPSWLHSSRLLVMMFYLNDVEEGGTTDFMHQDVSLKPTKGSLVIFPASWMYVHRGSPPLSGEKFILNMWLLHNNPNVQNKFKEIRDMLRISEITKNPKEWIVKNM